jgi:hypothetical protein
MVGAMRHITGRPGKLCLLATLVVLLAGCAGQQVLLCGGRVHNGANRSLEDIRIVHQPTGQLLTTNHILAGGDVDLAFDDREMKATGATIAWYDSRLGPRQETLALPRMGAGGGPQRLVYELDGAGQAAVSLHPCP